MKQCKYDAMTDKTVLVTVGTTKFDKLITTVLSPIVLGVIHVILLFKFTFFYYNDWLFILHYIKFILSEYNFYYYDFRPYRRLITNI